MATLIAKTDVLEYPIELECAVLGVDVAYAVQVYPVVVGSTILVSAEVIETDIERVAVPLVNIMGVEVTGVHFRGERTDCKRQGKYAAYDVWDELVWSYIQAHCEDDVLASIRANEGLA
jgi:hypothetical protein